MPQVDISIVIVNYKSWLHLASCLDSLAFHSDSFNHEIVVVDNHSNDGKLAEFSKVYPDVVFVENTGNNGFANGCNLGASKSKGRYLLFLNPDTVGNENAIKSLDPLEHIRLRSGNIARERCIERHLLREDRRDVQRDQRFPDRSSLRPLHRPRQA